MMEKALNKPGYKFAVVQPILCPLHQWYTANIDAFCKRISDSITVMACVNVSRIDALIRVSQILEYDGLHLTEAFEKLL
jgi:hypothetical protein